MSADLEPQPAAGADAPSLAHASAEPIAFSSALRVWAYVGLHSFGGPAGQIATMQRVLVDERRWIAPQRFLGALDFCVLLPGPEAQQLAVYVGWLLHGLRGALAAGVLFVLPGALCMLALSAAYAAGHSLHAVEAAFLGIRAAVIAIVLQAVARIGRRALAGRAAWGIAAGAFVALALFQLAYPWVLLGAGCAGALLLRAPPPW
jgi:chromate transporter